MKGDTVTVTYENLDPPVDLMTVTPRYNRVRALNWCPKCFGKKETGLLVCAPCNIRLMRAYNGHGPMKRVYPRLDVYLANHRDSEAISYLGGS